MRKSIKVWMGVGAFILTGTAAARADEQPRFDLATDVDARQLTLEAAAQFKTEIVNAWAQGGEGGEGGEGGINPETVGDDPAEYAIALQVIAAHFDAGLAAYAGGEREAGAQMFAHGHSEIYAVMDELFKKLGVTTLGPKLEAAVAAAAEGKPLANVKRHVEDVRGALRDAGLRGPQPASSQKLQTYIVGELIERAAAQYTIIQKDNTLEPYLDGLGFAIAARREASAVLPSLRKSDKHAADALSNALKLLQNVYPGIKRPAKASVSEAQLLVAASRARLAVSTYR